MTYSENMLIKIAKRRNNKKRNYLLVNPLQGKHLPVSPTKSLEMMECFGNKLREKYSGEKILLIAFAETGTAIGGAVASCLGDNCIFMHTTREEVSEKSNYIFFSEEHSHATEQRLCTDKLKEFLDVCDIIIFIDDEITTGKTIINGITNMIKVYPKIKKMQIAAGSLINRMSDEHLKRFEEFGITSEYLIKLSNDNSYEKIAESIEVSEKTLSFLDMDNPVKAFKQCEILGRPEPRIGLFSTDYQRACNQLYNEVAKLCTIEFDCRSLLIMGTEEFMYPALFVGRELEKEYDGLKVYTHSTTRSPIATSDFNDYPIKQCNIINSLYDNKRETYIYNLKHYDKVIVITDSLYGNLNFNSLANALYENKCSDITFIKWR